LQGVTAAQTKVEKPTRLTYLFSDGNLPGTLKAFKAVLQERPDLRGKVQLTFVTESVLADVKADELKTTDVLLFDTMNQQLLERVNADRTLDLIATVRDRRGKVFAIGEGLLPKETYIKQGALWDDRARAYWAHMGFSNQVGLMKYALTQAGIRGLTLPAPQPSLDFGYYYPEKARLAESRRADASASADPTSADPKGSALRIQAPGHVFATWDEFDAWRQKNGKVRPGAPRVAVSFYKATYYSDETELLDAVVAEIERQGAEAIPMFGYPGAIAAQRLLVDASGTPRADVVLGFNFNFAAPDSSSYLARSGAPRRRACRCSKVPSTWRRRSWPARSPRPSLAARRRSRTPRPA
jgi:cobaltochelatase CobN